MGYISFLRNRALDTGFRDKELDETIYMSWTVYYPGAEQGEVLADGRGRGSLQ